MKTPTTARGFKIVEFTDLYENACSLQESSLATQGAIWLGVNDQRMHLSQETVAMLLPQLKYFAKHGELK